MADIRTHLPDEVLLDYAAGGAPEPVAVLAATHLALCPHCRTRHRRLEAVGGGLLEAIAPEPVADDALARCLARLDEPIPARPQPAAGPPELPAPLRGLVGRPLTALDWKTIVRGGFEAALDCAGGGFRASLLRMAPGRGIPRHTHTGDEITLVLAGGFSDGIGHYLRGDVCVADATTDHRPVADPDGECLCLIVREGRVRLTGRLGRLANPFIDG